MRNKVIDKLGEKFFSKTTEIDYLLNIVDKIDETEKKEMDIKILQAIAIYDQLTAAIIDYITNEEDKKTAMNLVSNMMKILMLKYNNK